MDNASRASSSEISGIFNKNAVMSRETLLSLAVPKSQATVLEDLSLYVHRNVAGNFALVEEKVYQNVERINETIASALELSPRRFVPEAFSNHISRFEQDPNHGNRIKRKEAPYKYKKVTLPVHRDVHNPDWNGRFVFAESLDNSRKSSKKTKSTTSDGGLKSFMDEFRHKAAREAKPDPDEKSKDQTLDVKRSRDVLVATYLFQKLPKKKPTRLPKLKPIDIHPVQARDKIRPDPQTLAPRDLAKMKNVIGRYKFAWEGLVTEFNQHASALITYKLLVDLSNLVVPPPQILPTINYFCYLFGLEPTWAAAKKYLLHEVNTFHRFLCMVNPLSIALPYLQAATTCYREQIQPKKADEEKGYKPIVCLINWIEKFEFFVKAILSVYSWRCRVAGVSNTATIVCPIVDLLDENDVDSFYWNIKQIDSTDSDFWDTFEKYLPLRYIEEIVDDEAGEVIEDNDTFDDVDLTTEAAFNDVIEAEKVIEQVTQKPIKPSTMHTYVNSRRETTRSFTRLKRGVSSKVLNNLSLDNIKSLSEDPPPVPMVSGVSKRLYDIVSISQSAESAESAPLKLWSAVKKGRLLLVPDGNRSTVAGTRTTSESAAGRRDSTGSRDGNLISTAEREVNITRSYVESATNVFEGLAAPSDSLGSAAEHLRSVQ